MATITKNKGNGKYKVMLTKEELNIITISLAVLDFGELEEETKEQELDMKDTSYKLRDLFETFTKVTKLYPQKTLEDNEIIDVNDALEKLSNLELNIGDDDWWLNFTN